MPNNICTVSGCNKIAKTRNLCSGHYHRLIRYGDPIATPPKRTIDGHSKNPEYGIYSGMKNRCNNPNDPNFINYGGRGIRVDKRWLGKNGFKNFLEDMGERPHDDNISNKKSNYSIERIDNNGPYSPENCRWCTANEQAKNRRTNIFLSYKGKSMILKDWAKESKISYNTLYKRFKRGDTGEMLFRPIDFKKRNHKAKKYHAYFSIISSLY